MHVNLKLKSVQACLLVIASVSMSGCASVATLQDWQFCCTNKLRASDAWKCTFSSDARKTLSSDFEAGFKKGYYDTAMNKDCRLPPVAPPKYWSARYQTCEGQACVQEWFRGYQHGIASAQSNHQAGSAEVPISPCAPVINKTGCGTCYSPDPCRCGSDPSGLPTEFAIPTIHELDAAPLQAPSIDVAPVESSPSHRTAPNAIPPSELPSPPVEKVEPTESSTIEPASQIVIPVSFGTPQGLIGGFGNKNDF